MKSEQATPDAKPALAALWMCGAIASFTAMAIAGRAIQQELDSFELMFWRSLIGFGIVLSIVLITLRKTDQGFAKAIKPTSPVLHLTRNLFHFAGQNLWFYGIMVIPLSQLVALEFTMPIWVALLAPLVLGERFTMRRLFVALLGFAGILIVAQPGVQPLTSGHLAGMLCAIGFAMNMMLTKRIMRTDSVICVLFWMTLSQTFFGFILAQWGGFTWPSPAIWGWLVVVGLTGLSAHYALSSALGLAPASTVAPMEFLRLPVIAFVGVWLYAEPLEPLVFAGAAVILLANWVNLRGREMRQRPT
ncbi:DMT family transporter [Roseinatronobacter bogoriensis]|nr:MULTISPECIES: DMT family transporter [Rhodobaca]MBB4208248.1 drug/metabolite transporter (DMT)-like permease [Rhodobaca bogoriensis DSM 18756]